MVNEVSMETEKNGDKNLKASDSREYTAEDIANILAARGLRSTVSQNKKPRDENGGASWGMYCASTGVALVIGLVMLVFF